MKGAFGWDINSYSGEAKTPFGVDLVIQISLSKFTGFNSGSTG